MTRGATLLTLMQQLRAEVRFAADAASTVSEDHILKQLLQRTQETLYDGYDWPHLRIKPEISTLVGAANRLYSVPAAINFERVESVVAWWNGNPYPMERGIGWEHYSAYDSEQADERLDPPRRWDVRWDESATVEKIELWPASITAAIVVQFSAIRKLRSLTADTHVADLDDHLIVLHAAADILGGEDTSAGKKKLRAAVARESILKGRTKGGSEPFILGGGPERARDDRFFVTRTS
jgi:hypothetical protein